MNRDSITYFNGMPYVAITHPINKPDAIVIENLQMDQLIQYIVDHNIKKACISDVPDFTFLSKCSHLEHVCVELTVAIQDYYQLERKDKNFVKRYDERPFYELKELKSISVDDPEIPYVITKFKIDLSRFPKLEMYYGIYKYAKNIDRAVNLKSLALYRYRKKDLVEFSGLKQMDTLYMALSSIESLKGCENLHKLQCVYLSYNRSLKDISELRKIKSSIRALQIESCGKIEDFSVLEELENLEWLDMSGNNKLQSIGFIKKMKNLKTFRCTMNIIDGDLTPCMNLSSARIFPIRRHYNLKESDMPNGKFYAGNDNIDIWRREI